MALINEEVRAINTAKPSALKIKSRLKGRYFATVMVWPLRTGEIKKQEKTKEHKTKTRAKMLRRRRENLPSKGKLNAPKSGIKMIAKSKF